MSEKHYNTSSNHIGNTSISENGSSSNSSKHLQRQFRQVSKILFIGLVLIVAPSVFLSSHGILGTGNNNADQLAYGVTSLPQSNDNSTLIKVRASEALFEPEPAAGLSNVFGPGGLFPFDNFNCRCIDLRSFSWREC